MVQDPRFMRPAEVDLLVGDPSKAGRKLGLGTEVSFAELVHMMVDVGYGVARKLVKQPM